MNNCNVECINSLVIIQIKSFYGTNGFVVYKHRFYNYAFTKIQPITACFKYVGIKQQIIFQSGILPCIIYIFFV